jgi:hypothetical protein
LITQDFQQAAEVPPHPRSNPTFGLQTGTRKTNIKAALIGVNFSRQDHVNKTLGKRRFRFPIQA